MMKKAEARWTTTKLGKTSTLGMTLLTQGGCWRGRERVKMISIKVRIV